VTSPSLTPSTAARAPPFAIAAIRSDSSAASDAESGARDRSRHEAAGPVGPAGYRITDHALVRHDVRKRRECVEHGVGVVRDAAYRESLADDALWVDEIRHP